MIVDIMLVNPYTPVIPQIYDFQYYHGLGLFAEFWKMLYSIVRKKALKKYILLLLTYHLKIILKNTDLLFMIHGWENLLLRSDKAYR